MDTLIKTDNLAGGYENNPILKNISINIKPGTMTAIIGPNGSGKSTMLKYIVKQLKTENRKIFVFDNDINNYSQLQLAEHISFVPQNSKQEYEFTVKELVALGRFCHNDISTDNKKVNDVIKLVGLNKIADRKITEISGGELQLAMLAKAICQETEVILLDEPTNNLDPKHQHFIMNILTKLKQQNTAIICVIHDLNMVFQYFEDVIMMKNGKILKNGKTDKTLTEKSIREAFEIDVKINPSHDLLPSTVYYIP